MLDGNGKKTQNASVGEASEGSQSLDDIRTTRASSAPGSGRTSFLMAIARRRQSLGLTVAVGAIAGLSAVCFALAIDGAHRLLFGARPGVWRLALVPVLASAAAGWLLRRWFHDARGSGIPQTKAAYHLNRGVIPGLVPLGKFLTGALCVGAGHSLGREGPSVQIGAGLASWIGQRLKVSPERVQQLVPVGASAALAAAFNTPIAAVLFSLEELIGDLNAPMLGSTVIASVVSVIIARMVLGNEPLFHVPDYRLVHPAELVAYGVLGLLGGALSLAFTKGLLRLRLLLRRWPASTVTWQPAVGGAVIAAVLILRPEAAGVGYDSVNQALNGHLGLRVMLVLCVVKLIATLASYATGNAGGVFGPSLFLGAMAGGAVGIVTRHIAPFPVGDVGAYALVGMGTLFAGIVRAPMTSVFMIFEITQDYQIVVPLMVANMLAFAISRHYQPDPLYNALLIQDGIHVPDHHGARAKRRWRARDVMSPDVPADVRPEALHVHPDHHLDVVFDRLRRSDGVLPVVRRDDAGAVEGVITPASVAAAVQPAPRPDDEASA